MTSAQPSWPAVTLIRAPSSVPAERTSHAGSPLKIVSAVRLRRRLRLHTKRIFVRSLVASKNFFGIKSNDTRPLLVNRIFAIATQKQEQETHEFLIRFE